MDPELRTWLTETMYVKLVTAVASDGTKTYGAATGYDCRTEPHSDIVGAEISGLQTTAGRGGELLRTQHRIFTEQNVPPDARIWLFGDSTSDATKARRIARIDTRRDELGAVDHYEIFV